MCERNYPPVLETERMLLRPLTVEDKPAIYKWAGDPQVTKYMVYTNYNSIDDADGWINSLYFEEKSIEYGFVFKETGELVGSGLISYNEADGFWTIGYNIRRDLWGRGLVAECCQRMITYVRDKYDAQIIRGTFANDNPNSGRVMEKLGMHYIYDCEYSKIDGSATFKAKCYEIRFE